MKCKRIIHTEFPPEQVRTACRYNDPRQVLPEDVDLNRGRAERLLEVLQQIASRANARGETRAGRRRIPAIRPMEEVRAIVESHCTGCAFFGEKNCTALSGCSRLAEYRALLLSPSGKCPRGVW